MASDSVKYPSPIHWIKAVAQGALQVGSREEAVREQELRCRLIELVEHVDVLDRGAVDRIRMPFLRQIALSQWGESALSDHAAVILLRVVDRLVAADQRLHRQMCQAIEALRRASGAGSPTVTTTPCTARSRGHPDKSEYS
jgi:hypothetical protein